MNFTCNFDCGVMHQLRSDCTRTCRSIVTLCSGRFDNTSSFFFDMCQGYCCEPTNSLAVAFLVVIAICSVLSIVFAALMVRRLQQKRRMERIMAKASWKPSAHQDAFSTGGHDIGGVGEDAVDLEGGGIHGDDGAVRYTTQINGTLPRPPGYPPLPDPRSQNPPMASSLRRSSLYDGEISLGFADDDFVLLEADRADGVSYAGSAMSRRLSRNGEMEAAVRETGQQWSQASSRQLSPRSIDGDLGQRHQVPQGDLSTAPHQKYLSSTDHRGRPLSSSFSRRQQQLAEVPHVMVPPQDRPPLPQPVAGLATQQMQTSYVGLGRSPSQLALSSAAATSASVTTSAGGGRRQSQPHSAITWDLFADVDLTQLDGSTMSTPGAMALPATSVIHVGATSTAPQQVLDGDSRPAPVAEPPVVLSSHLNQVPTLQSRRVSFNKRREVLPELDITGAPVAPVMSSAPVAPVMSKRDPCPASAVVNDSVRSANLSALPLPLPPSIGGAQTTNRRSSLIGHNTSSVRRQSSEYLWEMDLDTSDLFK